MKAQNFAPGALVLVSPEQLAELIGTVVDERLARHAERQEQARRPLTAQDCADRLCSGSLARWRDLRHRYPALDAAAAVGPPGKGRRWDAEKLAAAFAELSPKMRRRRADAEADPR